MTFDNEINQTEKTLFQAREKNYYTSQHLSIDEKYEATNPAFWSKEMWAKFYINAVFVWLNEILFYIILNVGTIHFLFFIKTCMYDEYIHKKLTHWSINIDFEAQCG